MKELVCHGQGRKSWDEVPDPTLIEPIDAIVQVDTTPSTTGLAQASRGGEGVTAIRSGTMPDAGIGGTNVTVTETQRQVATATARSTLVNDWAQHGACTEAEPDALFVRGAAQQSAKKVCVGCPVIAECLADSLDNHIEFGVWGGMTERERRALLKRRPEVVSWRQLFQVDRMREQRHAS